MKKWIVANPELAGLLLGLSDVVFRAIAAFAFPPSGGKMFGPLLLANVHHPNGLKALGMTTMHWFGISAIVLAMLYGGVMLCVRLAPRDYPAWRVARGLLAVVAGVLLLNVLESAFTGKVTDFIGIVRGTRFHAWNFGDMALTLALIGLIPSMLLGLVAFLRDPRRL